MFMSFLISFAPFFEIASWDFFICLRICFAVLFLFLDLRRSFIAFWRRGSVGRVLRICFADFFVGFRRKASMPFFATFSAPWIFTDFMSARILLKRGIGFIFFMLY